ncbi:MAG TPA: hypothetical protein VGE86_07925 [Thermoanaerobaculia bacterium]
MHNPEVRRKQVDGTPREIGHFPFEGGTLVVSGVEHGGTPLVSRVQTFELFRSDGALEWRRELPVEFEMIERLPFERLALAAGFRIVELFGDYARHPFDSASSPAMIWMLEKPT